MNTRARSDAPSSKRRRLGWSLLASAVVAMTGALGPSAAPAEPPISDPGAVTPLDSDVQT